MTLNSDNQLMSGTTLSREFGLVADQFDYGPGGLPATVV